MCGIFGIFSPTADEVTALVIANRQRGNQGIGLVYFTPTGKYIKRGHSMEEVIDEALLGEGTLVLGHLVSPTSRTDDIHPLEHEPWTLAHNGILLNFKEFKDYADINEELDSAYLLSAICKGKSSDAIENIANGISLFEGQQTCWMIEEKEPDAYLIYVWRVMSSLYQGQLNDKFAFSSVKYYMINNKVKQNELYVLKEHGLEFTSKLSPINSYI